MTTVSGRVPVSSPASKHADTAAWTASASSPEFTTAMLVTVAGHLWSGHHPGGGSHRGNLHLARFAAPVSTIQCRRQANGPAQAAHRIDVAENPCRQSPGPAVSRRGTSADEADQ